MATSNENVGDVGNRPEWILRLLYAPVKGRRALPIIGTTRLMKGVFLVDRKLAEEYGVETDFEFRAEKYGPMDEKVQEALSRLESDGLVVSESSQRFDGTRYDLTEEGERVAKQRFDELDSEQRELLGWIKGQHVLRSLPKLLSFVYNQYPEMAEKRRPV